MRVKTAESQDYSKGLSDYESEVYNLKKNLDEARRDPMPWLQRAYPTCSLSREGFYIYIYI